MKKLLVFLVMLGVMIGGAWGATDIQNVGGDVPQVIDFTLVTTSLDYESVTPGTDSAEKTTEISVSDNNNVNFAIDITLTGDTEADLFENIFVDLDNGGTYSASEQLDEVLMYSVTDDPAGAFSVYIDSILRVPRGFAPVSDASGTITYTITAT